MRSIRLMPTVRNTMRTAKPFFMLFAVFLTVASDSHADDTPLDTVASVDLDRYLGKWYEIARLPQRFQKGCINSTAHYSFRDDGDIRVVNECDIEGNDKRKKAVGRAWVKDQETNAKLRVQFVLTGIKLSFLSGRYWILDLGPDYDYAMIGDPSREYFWLLSRTPKLDDAVFTRLVEKAKALGFETSQFIINPTQIQ